MCSSDLFQGRRQASALRPGCSSLDPSPALRRAGSNVANSGRSKKGTKTPGSSMPGRRSGTIGTRFAPSTSTVRSSSTTPAKRVPCAPSTPTCWAARGIPAGPLTYIGSTAERDGLMGRPSRHRSSLLKSKPLFLPWTITAPQVLMGLGRVSIGLPGLQF